MAGTVNWQTAPYAPYKFNCCVNGGTGCQYKAGSPECNAAMRIICASPTYGGTPGCKAWAVAHPLEAEPAVTTYCQANGGRKDDPWCACILSNAIGVGGQINPFCVDEKCKSPNAFKPDSYIRSQCPSVYDCTQIVNMNNIGLTVGADIVANSKCGGDQDETQPENTKSMSGRLIIFVLVVILVSITVVIVLVIIRRSRPT